MTDKFVDKMGDSEKNKSSSSIHERFELLVNDLIGEDKSLYSEKDSITEERRASLVMEQSSLNYSLIQNMGNSKRGQLNQFSFNNEYENSFNYDFSYQNETSNELTKNLAPNSNNMFMLKDVDNNNPYFQLGSKAKPDSLFSKNISPHEQIQQSKRSISQNNLIYSPEIYEQNKMYQMQFQPPGSGYFFDNNEMQRGLVGVKEVGFTPNKPPKERLEKNKFNTSRGNNLKMVNYPSIPIGSFNYDNQNPMGQNYYQGNMNIAKNPNFQFQSKRPQFTPSDQNLSNCRTDPETDYQMLSDSMIFDTRMTDESHHLHPFSYKNNFYHVSQPNSRMGSTSNCNLLVNSD